MINSIQDTIIFEKTGVNRFKEYQKTDMSKISANISFKKGFVRQEAGIFRTGGISVWNEKTQRMIAKGLNKEKLEQLMTLLEQTENERILFCDIYNCKIFKRRLKAHFQCTHFLNNFTESFKQKFFESKWDFLMRTLKQFNEYKNQLTGRGVML